MYSAALYAYMESVQHYINEGILYEPVYPNIQDWPITKFFKRKKEIIKEVEAETRARVYTLAQRKEIDIHEIVEQTMYLERIRMKDDPWRVDPKDQRKFWQGIKSGLVRSEQFEGDVRSYNQLNEDMLSQIILRYASEITSTFKPASYHFAKRVLPFVFSSLLNASAGKTLRSVINHKVQLQEKVHLLGEIESLRKLASKGTIILVPTHFSNVDSILVGWSLHALGLPAFIYGAGLNLFNNQLLAYFMKRLGAYKVDRRKKNPVYQETLYAYSTNSIQHGVHSIFFPGGTRSRSGAIENRLKLGLLGTAIEAQRRNYVIPPQDHPEKVFIIPLVMSYHFVLEAASLINQHLTRTGKEQYYIIKDESASYGKVLKFLWQTFSEKSDIAMSFGKPMDIFGNFVDDEGNSHDSNGRLVDIKDYFVTNGEIKDDFQRDSEYTRLLGEKIVERYLVENHVFSSHLVAFVAFELLKKDFPDLDLYGLLRLPTEDRKLDRSTLTEALSRVLKRLRHLADHGKVKLASHMINDPSSIIDHGVQNLGIYHNKRPLIIKDNTEIFAENMNLLYFYHNRMVGYELSQYI